MPELSDWLNSINKTKKNLMLDGDPETMEKSYKGLAYVIRKIFSYFPDSLFQAQEMNKYSAVLDGRLQYEYFLHAIPKKSRFAKGIKVVNPDDLDVVKKYYNYSNQKARESLDILTPEQIRYMKDRIETGGIKKNK